MKRYRFAKTIKVLCPGEGRWSPDGKAFVGTVAGRLFKAGDVIGERDVMPDHLASLLRLRQVVELPAAKPEPKPEKK